mgnify:CR=1 FL=1
MKDYTVYILTNAGNSVVYVGVTNDIERRMSEHRSGLIPGFTRRYRLNKLIYNEQCSTVDDAIAREKQLKSWRRAKKEQLITGINPEWHDLAGDLQATEDTPE